MSQPVPDQLWKEIVANSPLVSVDLVVQHAEGVVLGKRKNQPAKGEWFVPGGVVRKGETLTDAVQRVAREELGTAVTIRTQLGAYEHRYDTSEFEGVSKHYVPIAFVVTPEDEIGVSDDQHDELRSFTPPYSGFHEYVQTYLDDYLEWKREQR